MKFGVFDHVDASHLPQAEHFETRLRLVEAMDRLGFDSYHTAEHHGTELGLAPSANVYLSAVAQRTQRLKFGPLVYLPALHHPMRLAQEICMLDQMSRGRLQIGVGSGAVWVEQKLMDVDPATVRDRFTENRDIILQALTSDEVTHHGKYYDIEGFPMVLRPYQKPRPPMWYGLSNPASAGWCAENDVNVVSLMPAAAARPTFDAFREAWARLGKAEKDIPVIGLSKHILVAETDEEAIRVAPPGLRPLARLVLVAVGPQGRALPLPLSDHPGRPHEGRHERRRLAAHSRRIPGEGGRDGGGQHGHGPDGVRHARPRRRPALAGALRRRGDPRLAEGKGDGLVSPGRDAGGREGMAGPALDSMSPFFIVRDVPSALAFYRDGLGFDVTHASPEPDPFFAIVQRGGAQLFLKAIDESVGPLPNAQRHPWARWDAYVHAPDPDALAVEFASRGVAASAPPGRHRGRPARLRAEGRGRLRAVLRPAALTPPAQTKRAGGLRAPALP